MWPVTAAARAALLGLRGTRTWRFRYAIVTAAGSERGWAATVERCSVTQNMLADIHRTAAITLGEEPGLDVLSERIRPYAELLLPSGAYASFPLGTFLLSTAPRQLQDGRIQRSVAAYDYGQVLAADTLADRLTVSASTPVTALVAGLLTDAGLTAQNITPSTLTLAADQDWAPGTTRLKVVNALLDAIDYRLWFDARGVAQVVPHGELATAPVEASYADDTASLLLPAGSEGQDLFAVPNRVVVIVSNPDAAPLRAVYTNDNPASPTSTVRRGRTITQLRTDQVAVDQTTADAIAKRLCLAAGQVYQQVTVQTGLLPHHADGDVIGLDFARLGVAGIYQETGWQLSCAVGSTMTHTLRRLPPEAA